MAGVIAGRRGLPIVSERRPTAASVADFQDTDRTIRPIRLPPCRRHQTGTMGTISDANRPPNLRFRNDWGDRAVDGSGACLGNGRLHMSYARICIAALLLGAVLMLTATSSLNAASTMSVAEPGRGISGHSSVLPIAARKRSFCQTQFQKCAAS